MSRDPKALAVFLDAAREAFGELAPEVARWVEHPDAVRELLQLNPALSRDEAAEAYGSCERCAAYDGEPHARDCPIAAAWRALGDPRGAADIERAHEEALRQNARLFPQWTRPGADEQAALNPRHVVQPWDVRAYQTSETILGIAATDLRAGDHVEYRLGGPPTQPIRRAEARAWEAEMRAEQVRTEESIAARTIRRAMWSREQSDARGMEQVEAEARARHLSVLFDEGAVSSNALT